MSVDDEFLRVAVDISADISGRGGFPVGAIIVKGNEIISQGVSDGKRHHDPTWHAEIDAIRRASARLKTRNLRDTVLYSSMEPCLMCYAACYWANISKIVFAVGKDQLDEMHYEKGISSAEISSSILQHWPIEIIHHYSQEARALEIVRDWEVATYG